LPKRKRVPPVVRPRPRKPSPRWDEERRRQLLIIALGAVVLMAVAVIALFGYYQTKVRPKGETVVQVGGRSFSLRYLERRLRYEIRNLTTQDPQTMAGLVDQVPQQVEREELMRQGAPEKGVDLSEEAIDAEIGRRENVPASADRDTFATAYREAVRSSGLSTEGYRDIIAADLAETALRAMFEGQAPKKAAQARFRVILLATEDEAKAALERLRNGEDFAVVAKELSQEQVSREQGGEIDWMPRGLLEPALDEAIFSLEVGQLSDVITGEGGLFIVEVLERQAERDTTPEQRTSLGSRAMAEWLQELRERLVVSITLDDDQRSSLLKVVQDEISRGQ